MQNLFCVFWVRIQSFPRCLRTNQEPLPEGHFWSVFREFPKVYFSPQSLKQYTTLDTDLNPLSTEQTTGLLPESYMAANKQCWKTLNQPSDCTHSLMVTKSNTPMAGLEPIHMQHLEQSTGGRLDWCSPNWWMSPRASMGWARVNTN